MRRNIISKVFFVGTDIAFLVVYYSIFIQGYFMYGDLYMKRFLYAQYGKNIRYFLPF